MKLKKNNIFNYILLQKIKCKENFKRIFPKYTSQSQHRKICYKTGIHFETLLTNGERQTKTISEETDHQTAGMLLSKSGIANRKGK